MQLPCCKNMWGCAASCNLDQPNFGHGVHPKTGLLATGMQAECRQLQDGWVQHNPSPGLAPRGTHPPEKMLPGLPRDVTHPQVTDLMHHQTHAATRSARHAAAAPCRGCSHRYLASCLQPNWHINKVACRETGKQRPHTAVTLRRHPHPETVGAPSHKSFAPRDLFLLNGTFCLKLGAFA